MKAFWYNENRKNIIGLEIRKLRREKKLSTRDLAAKIQVNGYNDITADALDTTPSKLLEISQKTL